MTLKEIRRGLLLGKKYGDKQDKDFRGFYYDEEKELIMYNHYGSSAAKLDDLDFVVNEIFGGLDKLEEKHNNYFIYA